MDLRIVVATACILLLPSCGRPAEQVNDTGSQLTDTNAHAADEISPVPDVFLDVSEDHNPLEVLDLTGDNTNTDVCQPECAGRECGPDGCGGECGTCEPPDQCHLEPVCQDGQCLEGTKLSCDDGNPCTHDLCAKGTGCFYVGKNTLCDDGDACTVGDKCKDGVCVPGEGEMCCASDTDCDQVADCNGTQTCQDGMCQLAAGSQMECFDDPNDCVIPGTHHAISDGPRVFPFVTAGWLVWGS
jgi:hypothetical protein